MKAIVLGLFTLLLLGGSACTKVAVFVHQPSYSSSLTSTHCKLQRELRNQNQQTDFWCWAASAHTVIAHLKQDDRIRQCNLLNAAVGLDPNNKSIDSLDCCKATTAASPSEPKSTTDSRIKCLINGWPATVFDRLPVKISYLHVKFDPAYEGLQGLEWSEIVTEICKDVSIDPQFVIRQNNSQILAQAAQGQGGAITITTGLFLADATHLVNADSGNPALNGTVTIQSPIAPASGKIIPLSQKPLIATTLLSQRCAALAGGNFSSFTVAGRDSLPAEPGSWLSSPLAVAMAEFWARPGNRGKYANEPERAGGRTARSVLTTNCPAGVLDPNLCRGLVRRLHLMTGRGRDLGHMHRLTNV